MKKRLILFIIGLLLSLIGIVLLRRGEFLFGTYFVEISMIMIIIGVALMTILALTLPLGRIEKSLFDINYKSQELSAKAFIPKKEYERGVLVG